MRAYSLRRRKPRFSAPRCLGLALAGLIVASGLTALPVAAPGAQALTQLQGGSGYPGDEITVILRASICLITIMLVWLGDYLL